MTYDKVKLLKHDNKQLGRKAIRLCQLNVRFCFLLSLFAITLLLIVQLNQVLSRQPKHVSLHQYVRNLFNDPNEISLRNPQRLNVSGNDESYDDEFELVWSDETVELFQDQLGIIIEDGGDELKTLKCRPGEDFIVSALPGPNDENLNEVLWQFISLIALESQTMQSDGTKELRLKAFVTEQMRVVLNQLFEG